MNTHKSCSKSRQVELGEVEDFRGTLIRRCMTSKHWSRLFKCWTSNLTGCKISRGQSACAM